MRQTVANRLDALEFCLTMAVYLKENSSNRKSIAKTVCSSTEMALIIGEASLKTEQMAMGTSVIEQICL